MIISHEHKFIFLKTRKTGGSSLELALRKLCGPDDVITPIGDEEELRQRSLNYDGRAPQNWQVHSWWRSPQPLFKRYWLKASAKDYGFYNHIPANDARMLLKDDAIWNNYFKFAFERNPWDRQVSAYFFRYRKSKNPPSFSEYMHRPRRAWINNYDIYSIDNEVCVDFVGRFENLSDDFGKVLKTVGLSFDAPLPQAKTDFRRDAKHYRRHYDEETRELVRKWYGREIALLGYEF